MSIEHKPWRQKHVNNTNQDKSIITLKMNDDEKKLIHESQYLLRQVKKGSTIKMLMKIGYKSITSPENRYMLDTVFGNIRRNKRLGIQDVKPEIESKY